MAEYGYIKGPISELPDSAASQNMQAALLLRQGKGMAVTLDIASDAYPSEVLFDILNSMPMPVFVFEPCRDEKLPVYLNKECLAMLGADILKDAIDGCEGRFERYISPDDRELVESQGERVVANIGKTISFEFHIMTREGGKHLVRAYSCACHDTSGSLIVVSLIVGLADRLDAGDMPLDAVTVLVPMQSFFKIMQRWCNDFNAYRDGTELAVLYIDIVNFHLINGDLISSDHYPEAYALVNGEPQKVKMFMRRKDGAEVLVRETVVPLADGKGRISWLVALFVSLVDQSYEHGLVRQIYQSATQDPVTGLPVRKYREAAIADALELYRRTGQVFAVHCADIDEFHNINNTFSHVAGDRVLKGFSDLLEKRKRRCDSFCRWGVDEFIGLLHPRSAGDIDGFARRYTESAESFSARIGSDDIGCAISSGIAAAREATPCSP